ncbi:PREDICTED: odorant receptor 43a [Rhagoletis zephyria]|uniref:odorant receptor 43a n=1 Tax=Rhagoletis zephyria TaxID=28612 RepID=UPI0008118C7A|nr:PREDICTED: odorant receptor 43a [Rhagoletis zephyria]
MPTPIEDNPLLSINVKLWKFLSVLLVRDWSRCVALVAPVCLMNAMQFVYLYQQWGDLATFILNTFFAVSIFNALLRTCFVIRNRDKFEALMQELVTLYDNIQATGDEHAKSVLAEATRSTRNISIFNLAASFSDIIVAMGYPLFRDQRIHPFGVALPGIDVTRSPLYEILYVAQLPSPFTLSSMYMPYVSLFASFAMFGKAALQILQNNLRNLCENMQHKSEPELFDTLRANIAYHARIAKYVNDFNELVTYMVLVEFLLFSCVICSLLFCINITNSAAEKMSIVMYIGTMLYVLFTYYWQANGILEMSLLVSDAAYEMQWYNCSQRFKRTLLIFITRTQRPLQIRVGKMSPMTMEVFQSLLNTSYSYFTLLYNLYND